MPNATTNSWLLLALCALGVLSACSTAPASVRATSTSTPGVAATPSPASAQVATPIPAAVGINTPLPGGDAALPNTPAGRKLEEWLAAFNQGKPDVMSRYRAAAYDASYRKRFRSQGLAEQEALLFTEMRELVPREVDHATDTAITILVEAPMVEEWLRMTLKVAPAAPHKITELAFASAQDPNAPAEKLSADEVAAELGAYLTKLAATGLFSGVVLVAKDGVPIFQQAYGLADQEAKTPNRVETRFNLASMNKMFTAVAIAQLAQQGRLAFDAPIATYLPDYPKPAADKVTLHHLLTHTAGLGDYFTPQFARQKAPLNSPREYFPFFANRPLAFEPGARFEYSNAGFIVLGAIVEQVSGQAYFDYIQEHIFVPAGMANSDFSAVSEDAPDRAKGYTTMGGSGAEPGPRTDNGSLLPTRGGPAGGAYSTAGDLLRFAVALQNHTLLNETYTDLVTTGKVAPDPEGRPDSRYAYGFSDARVNGRRVIGHNGGSEGANTYLDIFTDLGYTALVLSNYDPPGGGRVDRKLRTLLTRGAEPAA